MNIPFLNTHNYNLTRRSQNVIREFGGFENLIEYYKEHNNFLILRTVGKTTDNELTGFCRYLIDKEEKGITDEIDQSPDIKDEDIEKYISLYQNEKGFLSVRSQNALMRLENDNEFHTGIANQSAYFKKYFFNRFDFLKVRHVGKKSIDELERFRNKIVKTDEHNPGEESADIFESVQNKINNVISDSFTYSQVTELFNNGEYDFNEIFCIVLFHLRHPQKKFLKVLHRKFFHETPLSNRIMASMLNCTDSAIRQIVNQIYRNAIPRVITLATEITRAIHGDLHQTTGKSFISLDNFSPFSFSNQVYTPNAQLARATYDEVLKKDYTHIDKLISPLFCSYKIPEGHLYVSNKFILDVHLEHLLAWLDSRIYDFHSAAKTYVLHDLVKSFYTWQHISVSIESLSDLDKLVSGIIRQNIPVDKRSLQMQHINDVISEARSFLDTKKEMQSTLKILNHLREKGFQISRLALSKCLTNANDIFSHFGKRNWILNEWNKDALVTGSLHKIIHTLLSNSKDPIHISEIYNYINASQKVSLQSILTNLTPGAENTFIAFNCSYYGLIKEKYDRHWYKIPQFNPKHISKPMLNRLQQKYPDIARYISSLYNYPEQHVRFEMDLKAGKYGKLANRNTRKSQDT